MDPPEVGPRRYPGSVRSWGTWTRPPSHPEWAPVCPIPCLPRLKVLRAQLYTTTSWGGAVWLCQLGRVPGTLCPWMGTPTWGSRPIWDGYPDLGVAFLLGVGVGGGVGGREVYNTSPLYIPTRASARGLASYLGSLDATRWVRTRS